jgi:sortase (surface protein transpeptidase)
MGKRFLLLASILTIFGGAYLLLLNVAPRLEFVRAIYTPQAAVAATLANPNPDTNTIVIEKIGLSVAFETGTEKIMDKGSLWHRFPERGNPASGGNFILSGHRFYTAKTVEGSVKRSPMYYINKLAAGDAIRIFYEGTWYTYTVERNFTVKPQDIWIEDQTAEPQLTLYSCTLKGADDGREVVIAKQAP